MSFVNTLIVHNEKKNKKSLKKHAFLSVLNDLVISADTGILREYGLDLRGWNEWNNIAIIKLL